MVTSNASMMMMRVYSSTRWQTMDYLHTPQHQHNLKIRSHSEIHFWFQIFVTHPQCEHGEDWHATERDSGVPSPSLLTIPAPSLSSLSPDHQLMWPPGRLRSKTINSEIGQNKSLGGFWNDNIKSEINDRSGLNTKTARTEESSKHGRWE